MPGESCPASGVGTSTSELNEELNIYLLLLNANDEKKSEPYVFFNCKETAGIDVLKQTADLELAM